MESSESRCQVFHVCATQVRRQHTMLYSFLCPNGTIFNQNTQVCDWWFNVECDSVTSLKKDSFGSFRQTTLSPLISKASSNSNKIETIYSAIKAANEKFESENPRKVPFDKVLSSRQHNRQRERRKFPKII